MTNKTTHQTDFEIEEIVKQILDSGGLSYQQHFQLTTLCLSDFSVSDSQRKEINRVFDLLQTGELKLVTRHGNEAG